MGELSRNLRKWRLPDPAEDWRFDVSSMHADYDADLETCVTAARRALNLLGLVVTGGDLRESEARIDARSALFDQFRIGAKALAGGAGTRITFCAGREWTQEGGDATQFLRDEFDRCMAESNHLHA